MRSSIMELLIMLHHALALFRVYHNKIKLRPDNKEPALFKEIQDLIIKVNEQMSDSETLAIQALEEKLKEMHLEIDYLKSGVNGGAKS